MEHRTVTSLISVSSTSGSVQVSRPGHFRLGALGAPTPVDFFSPRTTQGTHSAPRPGTHCPESLGDQTPAFLSYMLIAHWFLAHRPIHIWLGALGGQTMAFDHLTFCCFLPLQPLAMNTFRPRHSGASLGQTVSTHTSFFLVTQYTEILATKSKSECKNVFKKTQARRKTEQRQNMNSNLNVVRGATHMVDAPDVLPSRTNCLRHSIYTLFHN